MNKSEKLKRLLGSEDSEKLAKLLRELYAVQERTGNDYITTKSEEVIIEILELFWSLDRQITDKIHALRIEMHSELGRLQNKYDAQYRYIQTEIKKIRKWRLW